MHTILTQGDEGRHQPQQVGREAKAQEAETNYRNMWYRQRKTQTMQSCAVAIGLGKQEKPTNNTSKTKKKPNKQTKPTKQTQHKK